MSTNRRRRWRRRDVLGSMGASSLLGALGIPQGARATANPPNVLYLMVDQCRAAALSCYGETNISTPALDTLAANGMRFTKVYNSHSSCTPARATLMSGRYPEAVDIHSNLDMLPEVPCLAEPFRDAGYQCGHVGKWHLNGVSVDHDSTCYVKPGWRRRGFDHFWASNRANHMYNEAHVFRDSTVMEVPNPIDLYGPYFRTSIAMEFLEARHLEPDVPWFLMVSFAPPHPAPPDEEWSPMIPMSWQDKVDTSQFVFRPNVPVGQLMPDSTLGRQDRLGVHEYLKLYYASLLSLDALIGAMLHWLRARDMLHNTIVVFTSDHGEMAGSHSLYEKEVPFDEANRVPLIVSWQGEIAPNSVTTAPTNAADIYASVLGLAGLTPGGTHHGRDLSSLMRGQGGPPPLSAFTQGRVESSMVEYFSGAMTDDLPYRLLRTDPWYYVEHTNGTPLLLFNMASDPYQLENRVNMPGHLGLVSDLSDWVEVWDAATADAVDTGMP